MAPTGRGLHFGGCPLPCESECKSIIFYSRIRLVLDSVFDPHAFEFSAEERLMLGELIAVTPHWNPGKHK